MNQKRASWWVLGGVIFPVEEGKGFNERMMINLGRGKRVIHGWRRTVVRLQERHVENGVYPGIRR